MTPAIQRPCAECGKIFDVPLQWRSTLTCSAKCRAARKRNYARNYVRNSAPAPPRKCQRCDSLLPASKFGGGNQIYCSNDCKSPLPQCDDGTPCIHCGRLFNSIRKRKYCSSSCRIEHFKSKHEQETEIPVVDIDEAPRRLAVAKLFDRFEGGGAFDHFEPPQWMNPADRRHWR